MKPRTFADFYRALHRGNPGDIEFYGRACQDVRQVLELGCGWGRIAIPLLERGCAITGVDQNATFLAQARNSCDSSLRGDFLEGDVRNIRIRDEGGEMHLFDRVLIPYNTLYALGGLEGARECLQTAVAHLRTDGEIWCDVYPIDEMHETLEAGEVLPPDDDEPVAELMWEGKSVSVLEETRVDGVRQHLDVTYRAIDGEGAEVIRLEMSHDYLTSRQIERLFESVGLEVAGRFGGFSGEPLDDPSQNIWVASRVS